MSFDSPDRCLETIVVVVVTDGYLFDLFCRSPDHHYADDSRVPRRWERCSQFYSKVRPAVVNYQWLAVKRSRSQLYYLRD